MVRVTELGAIVAPPVPAFYHRCSNMGEMIDHFARRAIDLLDAADASISTPWGGL
jgi:4-hydroxy-3-polyprenylbenzoate decarboxylase